MANFLRRGRATNAFVKRIARMTQTQSALNMVFARTGPNDQITGSFSSHDQFGKTKNDGKFVVGKSKIGGTDKVGS